MSWFTRTTDQGGSELLDKLLLLFAATMWGVSFFVLKDVTELFPVFFVLAVRFCGAALLLLVLFWRSFAANLDRTTVLVGVGLGVLGWIAYAFQTVGITMTTPGKNAFISGCYCIMVPFVSWAIGLGKPDRHSVVAALICTGGLALVGLDGGLPLNLGDILSLACAFFYALQYAVISKRGGKVDIWALSIWEFLVMGGLSLACTLVLEPIPSLALFTPNIIWSFAFLTVFVSAAAMCAVNYAISRVDPAKGALISSLESPIGVAASVAAGREALTGRIFAGFVLIFCAIVFSEAGPALLSRRSKRIDK